MRLSENSEIVRQMEGVEPYTPMRLLQIAELWERVMREKQASDEAHPEIDFPFAYHRNRQAFGLAVYMEKHGIAERRNIGSFQLDHFKAGDVVRLRKGQEYGTTHPSAKGPVKRDRTVTIHTVFPGYASDLEHDRRSFVANPKIEWVGTGGYYFWCDIEDIALDNQSPLAEAA